MADEKTVNKTIYLESSQAEKLSGFATKWGVSESFVVRALIEMAPENLMLKVTEEGGE